MKKVTKENDDVKATRCYASSAERDAREVCCIDMHTKDARAAGDTERLVAWRETPERGGIGLDRGFDPDRYDHVSDELYENTRREFSEKELIHLTLAALTINAWNRILISFRPAPGYYQPPSHH